MKTVKNLRDDPECSVVFRWRILRALSLFVRSIPSYLVDVYPVALFPDPSLSLGEIMALQDLLHIVGYLESSFLRRSISSSGLPVSEVSSTIQAMDRNGAEKR